MSRDSYIKQLVNVLIISYRVTFLADHLLYQKSEFAEREQLRVVVLWHEDQPPIGFLVSIDAGVLIEDRASSKNATPAKEVKRLGYRLWQRTDKDKGQLIVVSSSVVQRVGHLARRLGFRSFRLCHGLAQTAP